MRTLEVDVAIIGGGCIGSGILHELRGRGFSDLALIDQGRKAVSATSRSGGMLRVFHESPEHVSLALAHHHILAEYGRSGVFGNPGGANGSLYFFSSSRLDDFRQSIELMKSSGHPFELMDASIGKKRFPGFRWHPGELAVFEPLGTHLDPGGFVEALLRICDGRGVSVLDDFEVQRITPYLNRHRISGKDAVVVARSVVLAGGARILPRLKDLGLFMPLEAKFIRVFRARKTEPAWVAPNYFDRETLEYGRFGHSSEVVVSSRKPRRFPRPEWSEDFQVLESQDCYAPGRRGVMGRVPGHSNLFMATGWGGTGFKFSLAVARRMGDLLEQEFSARRMRYV